MKYDSVVGGPLSFNDTLPTPPASVLHIKGSVVNWHIKCNIRLEFQKNAYWQTLITVDY